jgi:hypothetical protein
VIVKREFLLNALQAVAGALTKKEDIQQSDCFTFKNGMVYTYNGNLAIRTKSGLPNDIEGAIKEREFLEHVKRMKVDEIEIEDKGKKLVLRGKGEWVNCSKQNEMELQLDGIENPEDWKDIPEGFLDALAVVQECAGRDEKQFATICLHITPDYVQACDGFQVCKHTISTGFENPSLIRKDSIKPILSLGVNEFCEGDNWVHFRNPSGLVLSCMRVLREVPLDALLENDGVVVKLPKGLAEKVASASVSSSKNPDYNQVKIILNGEKQKMYVIGEGETTTYTAPKSIDYTGKLMSFMISPDLLIKICTKYTECQISDTKLKVTGENFEYCTCLSKAVEKELKQAEEDTEQPSVTVVKKKKKKVAVEAGVTQEDAVIGEKCSICQGLGSAT